MFNVTMPALKKCRVIVGAPLDANGNPAAIDGKPTFASANPAICTFVTDPSDATGMTGLITSLGPLAAASPVSISADADLGTGVATITVGGTVSIVAGQAVGFAVTVGTPF